MVQYDSAVILKFAERLYRRANALSVMYAFFGAIIGGAAGYAASYAGGYAGAVRGSSNPFPFVGAVLFAAVGYMLGSGKAFMLKLQAQTALCQAQTEQNTRRQSVSTGEISRSSLVGSPP